MRIAVDAMGGDYAPREIVAGAVQWVQQHGGQIILVGPVEQLNKELANYDYDPAKIELAEASQVIGMDESPALALRKKKMLPSWWLPSWSKKDELMPYYPVAIPVRKWPQLYLFWGGCPGLKGRRWLWLCLMDRKPHNTDRCRCQCGLSPQAASALCHIRQSVCLFGIKDRQPPGSPYQQWAGRGERQSAYPGGL